MFGLFQGSSGPGRPRAEGAKPGRNSPETSPSPNPSEDHLGPAPSSPTSPQDHVVDHDSPPPPAPPARSLPMPRPLVPPQHHESPPTGRVPTRGGLLRFTQLVRGVLPSVCSGPSSGSSSLTSGSVLSSAPSSAWPLSPDEGEHPLTLSPPQPHYTPPGPPQHTPPCSSGREGCCPAEMRRAGGGVLRNTPIPFAAPAASAEGLLPLDGTPLMDCTGLATPSPQSHSVLDDSSASPNVSSANVTGLSSSVVSPAQGPPPQRSQAILFGRNRGGSLRHSLGTESLGSPPVTASPVMVAVVTPEKPHRNPFDAMPGYRYSASPPVRSSLRSSGCFSSSPLSTNEDGELLGSYSTRVYPPSSLESTVSPLSAPPPRERPPLPASSSLPGPHPPSSSRLTTPSLRCSLFPQSREHPPGNATSKANTPSPCSESDSSPLGNPTSPSVPSTRADEGAPSTPVAGGACHHRSRPWPLPIPISHLPTATTTLSSSGAMEVSALRCPGACGGASSGAGAEDPGTPVSMRSGGAPATASGEATPSAAALVRCEEVDEEALPALFPLSRLDREFTVLSVLGEGSFGRVCLVRHQMDNQLYAVKISQRRVGRETSRAREQQLQEVYALAHAGHCPHIVRYHDCWMEVSEMGTFLHYRIEYCDGGSAWQAWHNHGHPRPWSEAAMLGLLKQMALAVHHLHTHGIAHMDIKPANIYLCSADPAWGGCSPCPYPTESGCASSVVYKLGDLGLARKMDAISPPHLGYNSDEGDNRYLDRCLLNGPETPETLAAADIFALGACIIELSGTTPLPGSGPQWQALRDGDLGAEVEHVLSPAVLQLVRRMTQSVAHERPDSYELLQDRILIQAVPGYQHCPLTRLAVLQNQVFRLHAQVVQACQREQLQKDGPREEDRRCSFP
eukprot:RCo052015